MLTKAREMLGLRLEVWKLREWFAKWLAKQRTQAGDAGRAFVMLVILGPAADHLPRPLAIWLARLVGSWITLFTLNGRQKRRQLDQTFRDGPASLTDLARDWFSRPFLDFVILRRVIRGRDRASDWTVVEKNAEAVQELRDSGASFLIATGHFSRAAAAPLRTPRFIPHELTEVTTSLPPRKLSPSVIRTRTQFGQLLDVLPHLHPGVETLWVGKDRTSEAVLQRLAKPGHAIVIHADAPWRRDRKGSIVRAFAGYQAKSFATGLARLCRLSQRPI